MERLPAAGFYTRLLQLKKRSPALANGDACGQLTRLPAPPTVFAFVRHRGPDAVLVAVNLGPKSQEVSVPAAWQGRYRDVFADQNSPLTTGATLPVPPHGYRVLERSAKP